ncbi:hypothetical protein F511_11118 [Dorcoceras hygrometricum]|uniref:Uncharacterized protein n=1 Tax=Dorcoceras hygrometricum TaxID=472368 RepID=A0A2Z7C5C5_9LAMI|nr:hypothetical protein F511_11118 [Dorcoceras hygrometricum]
MFKLERINGCDWIVQMLGIKETMSDLFWAIVRSIQRTLLLGNGGGSGSRLPAAQWKRAWLQPESQGDWLFTVGGGRFVQSSPRPEARFLRQPALESLTRSARTETPRNDRNKSDQRATAAGGGRRRAWLQPESQGDWLFTVGGGRFVQSSPRPEARFLRQPALESLTRSARTETPRNDRNKSDQRATAAGGGRRREALEERGGGFSRLEARDTASRESTTIVARYRNIGLAHRIMVKRLATSPHDPLGITDSACKNQLVVVSVHYGPFNPYIPIRSTTIGKSRVARDPISMHTSWRSNSDITSVTSPKEGSSIDHQVTIYLHAQNITMFPTNETWYFASQTLVSSSGGLILILTAQSTRN